MTISVHNITATSATISWRSMPGCMDAFYSVMYHPDWNSLLMGHARKSFMREERIPASQTTTQLGDLSPQTSYVLCITCQSANPSKDQCQLFSTLDEGGHSGGGRRELAVGVWLASTILLVIIAAVLLWRCVHYMYTTRRYSGRARQPGSAPLNKARAPRSESMGRERRVSLHTTVYSEEDSHQAIVIENPFHTKYEGEPINGQCHRLMTRGKW